MGSGILPGTATPLILFWQRSGEYHIFLKGLLMTNMSEFGRSTRAPVFVALLVGVLVGAVGMAIIPKANDSGDGSEPPIKSPSPIDLPSPVEVEVKVPPPANPPEKLPEEAFLERYPVGKTIRSIAHLDIQGMGSNSGWSIKGTVHFNHLSQVAVETRVMESDPEHGRLVFEQSFAVVLQQLMISDQELEFVPPDSLPIRKLWPAADEFLQLHPGYHSFRRAVEWADRADPALKRTLTTVNQWLKRAGVTIQPMEELETKVLVDKLAGTKYHIVYQSGIGVTSITALTAERFTESELIRLARSCNVVADYFLFPLMERRPGEVWDVRASDVGNLLAFHDPTAELNGKISVSRGADEIDSKKVRLELRGGAVRVHSMADGKDREATLTVKEGTAWFDQEHRFVRQARISLSATAIHQSRDHLLFGTEKLRDLTIGSRYEAEFVSAIEAASSSVP